MRFEYTAKHTLHGDSKKRTHLTNCGIFAGMQFDRRNHNNSVVDWPRPLGYKCQYRSGSNRRRLPWLGRGHGVPPPLLLLPLLPMGLGGGGLKELLGRWGTDPVEG